MYNNKVALRKWEDRRLKESSSRWSFQAHRKETSSQTNQNDLGVSEARWYNFFNLSFHFKILDSISSKLSPLVSGTTSSTNKSDNKAIAPKRRKRFSAPKNSCNISQSLHIQSQGMRTVNNEITSFERNGWIHKSRLIPSMVRMQKLQWHSNQS